MGWDWLCEKQVVTWIRVQRSDTLDHTFNFSFKNLNFIFNPLSLSTLIYSLSLSPPFFILILSATHHLMILYLSSFLPTI